MHEREHDATTAAGHEHDPLDEVFDAEADPRVGAVLHAASTRLPVAPDELTARRHLKATRPQLRALRRAARQVSLPVLVLRRTAVATAAAAALALTLAFTGSLPAPAQELAADAAEQHFRITLPRPPAEPDAAPEVVELPEQVPDRARIPEQVPVPGGQGPPDDRPGVAPHEGVGNRPAELPGLGPEQRPGARPDRGVFGELPPGDPTPDGADGPPAELPPADADAPSHDPLDLDLPTDENLPEVAP